MKNTILTEEFLEPYKTKEPPFGGNGLGYLVYKRTYAREIGSEGQKEEWWQTVARCVEGAQTIGAKYTKSEAEKLFDYVFNLKCSFSGRALWQLGTEMIDQFGGPSLLNCYYTNIEDIKDFEFLMTHLMLGGGVGFSVERASIHSFKKIKNNVAITHLKTNDADFIVPDSRHGWAALLNKVLTSFFETGESFSYSTILIRGRGAPLKTFGGTASGPEILIEGIEEICNLLSARVGKKIRSIDALDICNIIGKVVVAGSARRSAQLAAGDPDDYLFLRAKRWDRGDIPAYRSNSNNSILADDFDEIIEEVWSGYLGNGEPYGLLNRKLARQNGRLGEKINDSKVVGTNPCSEIWLEDGENCNLSEIFLPNVESRSELYEISQLLYKTQKAITSLWFPFEKTRETSYRNRRLGLGVTGWLQSSEKQISWLDGCYKNLRKFDENWSAKQGITKSIKLTTVKPSGTLSLLPFVTPGIHPGYSRFFIRRVRIGTHDPLVKTCRDLGYPVKFDIGIDGRENHSLSVVEFPCEYPEGTTLAKDLTAIDQLEWVVKAQSLWSDNAVSVTVYYRKEELPEVKDWLKNNYSKKVKSVSFLLHQDHGFELAPYEPIDEEQYNKIKDKITPMTRIDDIGNEDLGVECEGGACPIK
jgi:ribonucleoside-triphosphate reductase